jgi:membrane-associated phospholipid phosphatase
VRSSSYDTRGAYADASDVLLSLSISGPILVDSLAVAYWYRGSPDVAWEIALIDVETFLATAAVQGIFSTFTARERPYGRVCGKEIPADNSACDSYDRYRSFFSGHTSLAFTSASLVCSHHLRLDLFDSRSADVTACVTSYVAAAATGTLRILGDRHYATDVVAGAIIGTSMGLAVPYFLHYRVRRPAIVNDGVRVGVVPNGAGLSLVGAF